jgi:hypothetical protein
MDTLTLFLGNKTYDSYGVELAGAADVTRTRFVATPLMSSGSLRGELRSCPCHATRGPTLGERR